MTNFMKAPFRIEHAPGKTHPLKNNVRVNWKNEREEKEGDFKL